MSADTYFPYPKEKQLNPTKPIKAPIPEPKKPPKRRRYLTKAERAEYTKATERARCDAGYIRCEGCSIPLLDHQAQRHHVVYRSHGGPTIASNLAVFCSKCHDMVHRHGGKVA